MIQFNVKEDNVSMDVVPQNHVNMTVESAVKVDSSGTVYAGPYEITPTVEGLKMDTKDKHMKENVDILPIPFFSVSNQSGGNTVYIAKEIL